MTSSIISLAFYFVGSITIIIYPDNCLQTMLTSGTRDTAASQQKYTSCFCNLVTVVEGQCSADRKQSQGQQDIKCSRLEFHWKPLRYEHPRDLFLSLCLNGHNKKRNSDLSPAPQRAHLFTHDLCCAEWQAQVKFFERRWQGQAPEPTTELPLLWPQEHRMDNSSSTGQTTKQ